MTEIDKDLQILAFSYTPEEQDRLEALVCERDGQMTIAEAIELMEREREAPAPRALRSEQRREQRCRLAVAPAGLVIFVPSLWRCQNAAG